MIRQLVCVMAIFGLFNNASAESPAAEGWLTPEQALTQVKEHKALLVDVRTAEEFASGHLEGALNISHELVGDKLELFGSDKDREIVVYCRSGNRSGKAREELMKHGFTKVFNAGGYTDLRSTWEGAK